MIITFVKLLTCGSCGSGVCAEEKFKKLKDGTSNRYLYYHCTRSRDRKCKEKSLREEELSRQLIRLIDKVDIDDISITHTITQEINRFRKFSYAVLGEDAEVSNKNMEADIRRYAKYVLTDGSKQEIRQLLSCLRSKLELKDKVIYLRLGGEK